MHKKTCHLSKYINNKAFNKEMQNSIPKGRILCKRNTIYSYDEQRFLEHLYVRCYEEGNVQVEITGWRELGHIYLRNLQENRSRLGGEWWKSLFKGPVVEKTLVCMREWQTSLRWSILRWWRRLYKRRLRWREGH